jgi:hypothetical protein
MKRVKFHTEKKEPGLSGKGAANPVLANKDNLYLSNYQHFSTKKGFLTLNLL